jgi:hypothetical protein
VKAYSLNHHDQVDAVVVVVSAEQCDQERQMEKELIACKHLNISLVPVVVLSTHSSREADRESGLKILVGSSILRQPVGRSCEKRWGAILLCRQIASDFRPRALFGIRLLLIVH